MNELEKLSNNSFTECEDCGHIEIGEANNYCKNCDSFNVEFIDHE